MSKSIFKKKFFVIFFSILTGCILGYLGYYVFDVLKNKDNVNYLNYKVTNNDLFKDELSSKCSLSVNLDKSYVFGRDENPFFGVPWSIDEGGKDSVHISLYKLKNDSDYVKNIIADDVDLDKLTFVKEYDTITKQDELEKNRAAYFEIPEHLENGYYMINYSVDKCQNVRQFFIVSDLSVYVGNVEREILTWVVDNKTKKPIQNIEVIFEDNVVKTDKDGIAKISNLRNVDDSYKKYLKVKNGQDEVLVLVNNFNSENYYKSFVYSDKPIYKPSDTVHLWGYTPVNLYIDDVEYDKFKILDGENEYPVTLSDTGIFTTSYKLNDKNNGYVKFYYKDNLLEDFTYIVTEYKKPEIEIKIITDKNNYMYDDVVNATFEVKKLTGEVLSGVEVYAEIFDKKSCVTDDEGKCNITFSLEKTNGYNDNIVSTEVSASLSKDFEIYEGDLHENEDVIYTSKINIVYNDILFDVKKVMQKDNLYYYDLITKKISIENDVIIYTDNSYDVNVEVLESICSRSKKRRHVYNEDCDIKNTVKEVIKTINYKTNKGKYTIKDLNYLASLIYESDSATSTNYVFDFSIVDSYGHKKNIVMSAPYVDIDNYYLVEDVSSSYLSEYRPWVEVNEYGLVDTFFIPIGVYRNISANESKYHIGESLPITMYRNSATKIESDLKLSYFYKENVIDTLFNTEETIFKDEYFPGVNLSGAYYNKNNQTMNLVKNQYLDFEHTDRLVNINMVIDKAKYHPNEEVELKIKVTDKDGKGVKTDTLVSVVDEAIFYLTDDRNNEIESIYVDKYFSFYQYATYQPLPFMPSGGDGDDLNGIGGLNNGDTIYFENVKTDENGEAVVKFKLNSLETKFRITAISVNQDLYYGTNRLKFISKKD